jgi:HEAT repeats/Putative zinc-finger
MECGELTEYALGRLLGETASSEREELRVHLAGCASCRTELAALEDAWETLGGDPDLPVTPEFRSRTVELLEDEIARWRIRSFRPRLRVRRLLAQAAAILVAAALGYAAARKGVGGTKSADVSAPAGGAAASWPDLSKNPRLTNVSYRTDADGRVAIEFDATTRRSITGPPDDPRVSSLLAYLLSRNETAGEKSRAIELVSQNFGPGAAVASPEIVRALAATLKRDRNPGVRKKAAEALASFRSTTEIRAALLDALANDPNPGVRLVAVDALAAAAKEAPDPKTIQSLREKAFDPSENGFVRARAASALKAINL